MPEAMTPNESPEYKQLYTKYVEARELCTSLTMQFGVGSMQAKDAELTMRNLWHKLCELGDEPEQQQA